MSTDQQDDTPDDFFERLQRLEREITLKEDEIRAIRQNLRKVEAAYWEHLSKAELKSAQPAPAPTPAPAPSPTPQRKPPPLPPQARTETPVVTSLDEPPEVADQDDAKEQAPEPAGQADAASLEQQTPPEPAQVVAPAAAPEEARELEEAAPRTPTAPAGATTQPFAAEPEKRTGDLETRIGAVWFNRIGLVILIIGFALMARLIVPSLQPWMKLAAMYLASWALLGAGVFFDRRYPTFARPVTAGALALTFFASFAGYYIEATACLPLALSLLFMFISAACILLFAERWDSESTAGLAIFLGHVAAYVGGVEAGTVPLVAILLLTATAAVLFIRHRWQPLSLFAVVAAFVSHFLWFIQDHGAPDPASWFWLNFAFLTSYYVVFLLADLLLRRKDGATGIGGVGPVAMVLYSAMTVWLFFQTGVYWSSLHIFLLSFAGLQAGLTALYALRKQSGYGLYGVAGVLFLTLGVFAWLDGLTLTLTLAVEGVVVMMLARRDGFRFMYPVAQLVLGAGFIHYWTWGSAPSSAWPDLLANLVAALAFLFAAYLEEHWPASRDGADSTTGHTFGWIRPPAMAAVHAIGAGAMAAYQAGISLSAVSASLGLGMAVLVTLFLALVLRARCWAWAIWILQLRLTGEMYVLHTALPSGLGTPEVLDSLWQVHQAVALAITGGAVVAVLLGYAWRRAHPIVMGAGMLILGVGIPLLAPFIGRPEVLSPAMIFATPILYWSMGAAGRRRDSAGLAVAEEGWLRPVEKAVVDALGSLRVPLACLGAVLLSLAVWQAYPGTLALLYLSGAAFVVLAAIAAFDAPALAAGLVVHLALLVVRTIYAQAIGGVNFEAPAANWVFVACAGAVVILGLLIRYRRRASLALAARGSLACFTGGAIAAHASGLFADLILWVWLALMSAAWFALEWMARPSLAGRDPAFEWRDRHGLGYLQGTTGFMTMVHAGALTVLLWLVLASHYPSGIAVSWALFAATLVLAAAALALRSARFAVGATLALGFTSGTAMVEVGPASLVNEHPAFVVSVIVYTLVCGICAEVIRRTLLVADKAPRWRSGLSFLMVLHYGAGLVAAFAAISLRFHTSDWPVAFELPAHVGLVIALFLPVAALRLPTYGYFVLVSLHLVLVYAVAWLADGPDTYREGLLMPAVISALMLVVGERVLAGKLGAFPDEVQPSFKRWCRILSIIAAAVLVATGCLFNVGVEGYLTTLGWSLTALVLMVLGFLWQDRAYRYTALGLFLLSIGRVVFVDISGLSAGYRTMAFICLGACLLAVSFLYTRFKDRIQKWL